MKNIIYLLILLCVSKEGCSQNNSIKIKIENSNIAGLISFVQASKESLKTPSSFAGYIHNKLGADKEFNQIIEDFSIFDFSYSTDDLKYPINRNYYFWIAATNSDSLEDFSNRIIGYLPHYKHIKLIELLYKIEPYYYQLIVSKEQKNIQRMRNKLSVYDRQMGELFLKASKFYETNWNTEIPFKIIINPIPVKSGRTAAIAMGNVVLCEFLSHNTDDFKDRLGVIFHEMCHILYLERLPETSEQFDKWFSESKSPYAKMAYRFINEALATAIGNGWAYEKFHGEMDEYSWYSTKYINDFAHAIFPLVKRYIENEKSVDKKFVDNAIILFEDSFPKILSETKFLMSEIQLYTNAIHKEQESNTKDKIREALGIRSMWSYKLENSKEVKESLKRKNTTKVFIINSANTKYSIKSLDNTIALLDINTPVNTMQIFQDESSNCTVIVIHIKSQTDLKQGLEILSVMEYLDIGKTYKIN